MASYLYVIKGIKFPLNAVTQKFSWLGRSGSGKTYGAGKFAEELIENDLQTVIIDSVGCWYGLRMDKNGKPKGYSIPIFGGEHGDVPLIPTSGKFIARLIVEKRIHAILDISLMRKKDSNLFLSDFAEEFLHLKKSNKSPVHLMLEEAQKYIPQNVPKGQEKIIGDMEDICKVGRNYGIGISILSQRPQAVHKDCLNQTEILMAFQMNAKHDRKAIEDWVEEHCDDGTTHVEKLSTLEVGECFIWSPQWLKVLEKVKILPKITADTSQTPSVELNRLVKSKSLAPVDLAKIKLEMEVITKEKKENDPAELKKEILQLKKELNQKPSGTPAFTHYKGNSLKQLGEKKDIYEAEIKELRWKLADAESKLRKSEANAKSTVKTLKNILIQSQGISYKLEGEIKSIEPTTKQVPDKSKHTVKSIAPISPPTRIIRTTVSREPNVKTKIVSDQNSSLGKCERNILIALAQKEKPATRNQVAILSGYAKTSGSFNNSISRLNSNGYISKNGEVIDITPEGLGELGEFTPLPSGADLQTYWLTQLGKAESAILAVLIEHYPTALEKQFIADQCNYAVTSGSFNNSISKLRTLELAEGKNEIKASDSLFN